MAASDQTYRNQYTLDVVFAVSSILMILSTLWMFGQDYYRPYKAEQREFRTVEVAVAQRLALDNIPSKAEFTKLRKEVEEEKKKRDENAPKITELDQKIQTLTPDRERANVSFQSAKSELESISSFYNLEVERSGPNSPLAQHYLEKIQMWRAEADRRQQIRDQIVAEIRQLQSEKRQLETPLIDAQGRLKKLTDDFQAQVQSAAKKQWGWGDTIRSLPILDAFADPLRIQQYTIDDVPIDYNFKYVTRFDRCTSCHLGIDRPEYSKDMLRSLAQVDKGQEKRLQGARDLLAEHRQTLEGTPELAQIPEPDDLQMHLMNLTEERVNQFCAHPRLDLFVGDNSKHPAEKFGCSSCHSGQGSATEFSLAAHTPNDYEQMKRWINDTAHGWDVHAQHHWDFPMLPMRFIESSCVKCHHEVTDLISVDNRVEAPKLMRGYNLVRDLGCFGCHEITGRKYNRPIGPDLRLEPTPPLEELTTAERDQLLADPDNPPGTMRKVGPSLYRIAEKTNEEWTAKWLRSPRSFRPDTRMPHFYDLANNHPDVLADDQKKFPDAEMHAITYYLFKESQKYLDNIKEHRDDTEQQHKEDLDLVHELTLQPIATRPISDSAKADLQKQLDAVKKRIRLREAAPAIEPLLKDYEGDYFKGRDLFVKKGCMACHQHDATTRQEVKEFVVKENDEKTKKTTTYHTLENHAEHGPDLSQIKAKLGSKPDDVESARLWLANWIKDPAKLNPRTRMPVVPMTDEEILDITAWLLDQKPARLGTNWEQVKVETPDEKTLKDLADVYLVRQLSDVELQQVKEGKQLSKVVTDTLPQAEQELLADYNVDSVRYYVGRKAVGRQGCFACHDIPGFDDAKPIGVELNDWARKDPHTLAFEDVDAYIKAHFKFVDSMTATKEVTVKGKKQKQKVEVPQPFQREKVNGKEVVKRPYEKFFHYHVKHHDHIGFLHQKLLEPRSYDYNRISAWDDETQKRVSLLAWDELARMPQFQFSYTKRRPGESDQEYEARAWKEETEAREAVMTFVLGLVAEKVPIQSLAQPTGDRLAQVKGRKILTDFNCNGCHTIQPGEYEFALTDDMKSLLDIANRGQQATLTVDHTFFDHHAWTGGDRRPEKMTLKAYGVPAVEGTGDRFLPKFDLESLRPGGPKKPILFLRLTEALRFFDAEGKPVDIRAGGPAENLAVHIGDMLYPPPQVMTSPEAFAAYEEKYGAFGGIFAEQLTRYLIRSHPDIYKEEKGDSIQARAAAPPPLIGQGGRTQPGWLHQFLLNPQPIREMAVLRMPRFNLSEQDAQDLVDYFTAVERLTNPRFGVGKGAASVPQQAALKDDFWRKRTQEYVQYLKNTKEDSSGKTLYQQRVELFEPHWKQIADDFASDLKQAKKQLEAISEKVKDAEKAEKKVLDSLKDNEDAAQVAKLAKQLEQAQRRKEQLEQQQELWKSRAENLEKRQKKATPDMLKKQWEQEEAYVVDGFRVLIDAKNLCAKCHQIGPITPTDLESSGPALKHAQHRLRPDWVKHWIAHPSRLVTYPSPMVNYFQKGGSSVPQHLLAGSEREQFRAVGDTLMIYDRLLEMPLPQRLLLPIITADENDKADNKEGDNK